MSRRKKKIKFSKERVILSDVLPYEVPLTFSNRHLYRFLVSNGVELSGDKIIHRSHFSNKKNQELDAVLSVLFSNKFDDLKSRDFRKIPFTYRISHKVNEFRELALIAPINQLKLIGFYEQYKESIIHSCSRSNYSIRKPVNIAKHTYFNDKLHQKDKGSSSDFLELSGKEYENLKTFFVYRKYSNIFRFYEDYRYHRAEKKYNHLFKFDISKCFDSIYTHSLVWAILGWETVKENVEASKNTFGGKFDHIAQYANYGETNGILIGPEFSRIFAEITLQRIDYSVEQTLLKHELRNKVNYELYRYVDDFFLFADDERIKDTVQEVLQHELKRYKLSLNSSKYEKYDKPIITDISIAKSRINDLFSTNPKFEIVELEDIKQSSEIKHSFNLNFDSDNLIMEYKSIIKTSGVNYKDVLNYTLAGIRKVTERNLKKFEDEIKNYHERELVAPPLEAKYARKIRSFEEGLVLHVEGLIDFLFFIYSVSARVNSTITTGHILSLIIHFFKQKRLVSGGSKDFTYSNDFRGRVFKKILDESTLILRKNRLNEYAQVESLYLLTVLKDLGKEYRLSQSMLIKFINAELENDKVLINKNTLNYFSITVLLYYIDHSTKYSALKQSIKDYTIEYIRSVPKEKRGNTAELIFLIFDIISCPYLDYDFKEQTFLTLKEPTTASETGNELIILGRILSVTKTQKYWFTKWNNFNLVKEFENKKSQEVYS